MAAANAALVAGRDRRGVLRETRLIYVTPPAGRSGVGDYAADFAVAVTPYFHDVITVEVESDTARDVARDVRRIRALAEEQSSLGPTIVHFEQSGASLASFWGALLPRRIPVTATIHDPPQPVWWPFATRSVLRHRLLHHGVHYPLQVASNALQRRVTRGRTLIALTSIGARETARWAPAADVRATRIFIPSRPPLAPLTERPVAVGLFGYLYKAKGFDGLHDLRDRLDDDIDIVVAGRGTEALTAGRGITVLGEVNGADEDRFFAGIRALLVPYAKNTLYGLVFAASSTISRSHAYGTPVICTLDGALPEAAAEGGTIGIDGGIGDLARCANSVVRDDQTLDRLADEVAWLKADRTVENCAAPFLQAWADIASEMTR